MAEENAENIPLSGKNGHYDGSSTENDGTGKPLEAMKILRLLPKSVKRDIESAQEKDNSPLKVGLITKICSIIWGLGASLLCWIPMSIISIALIVVGAVYKNSCPGQRYIPIWMIVFGSVSLFQLLTSICRLAIGCCERQDEGESMKRKVITPLSRGGSCCEFIVSLFLFAWIIVGSVWVFGYYHVFNSAACVNRLQCCAAVPFTFSFVVLILIYAVMGIVLLIFCCCCCCCLCCFACCARNKE